MAEVPEVIVINAEEVRRQVTLPVAIAATKSALTATARGIAASSCISHLDVPPHGEAHIKGAMMGGSPVFALKVSTGFPGNVLRGLPPTDGFSAVFDSTNGILRAVVLDGGYLTELRTAAAGAIALDALSSPNPERVLIVGTGGQARHQIAAARHVRPSAEILVAGRSRDAVNATRAWAKSQGHGEVTATSDLESAVRSADAIVTATYARTPLFDASWVKPTAHITAVGADAPGKREIPVDLLRQAALVTADDLTQSRTIGELQGVPSEFLSRPPVPLGELLLSPTPRPSGISVTDLTGLGVEDASIVEALMAQLAK